MTEHTEVTASMHSLENITHASDNNCDGTLKVNNNTYKILKQKLENQKNCNLFLKD
jgi:hypothetical protein